MRLFRYMMVCMMVLILATLGGVVTSAKSEAPPIVAVENPLERRVADLETKVAAIEARTVPNQQPAPAAVQQPVVPMAAWPQPPVVAGGCGGLSGLNTVQVRAGVGCTGGTGCTGGAVAYQPQAAPVQYYTQPAATYYPQTAPVQYTTPSYYQFGGTQPTCTGPNCPQQSSPRLMGRILGR